jgi:acetoin utilization deacetylase AcuC-like enzyme
VDVFWHDDALLHDTGRGVFDREREAFVEIPELHPENAERVQNMRSVLQRAPGELAAALRWRAGRRAERDELEWLHEPSYIDEIEAFCAAGGGFVTQSTMLVRRSFDAARAAAGTALAAVAALLDGEAEHAFALVRPPGHHAQPARADGYCIFSNAALAAELARRRGVERVAVLDWDVHHGNGTQECFYDRADVLTISLHMRHGSWGPSHPQSGAPDEVGRGDGEGFNVNVELPLGTGDGGYLLAIEEVVRPIVDAYRPGLLVVAVGQDANQYDPNGRQSVTMAGFRALGGLARALADAHCDGRMVLVQEGGYAFTYSAYCLHATLAGVLGLEQVLADPLAFLPDDPGAARPALARVREALAPFWSLHA